MRKVFKVSCYSTCGSYFGSYLQSVTTIAETKEDALECIAKWLDKEGKEFLKPLKQCEIEDLGCIGVVDFTENSDY